MKEPRSVPPHKLRVLHVLRAPLGGLFRHVVDLTREQIARGHEVGLIVDSLTGGTHADTVLAELQPHLALGLTRMPMLRKPQFADVFNTLKVEGHARRLRADVIHGHGSKGGVYARGMGVWRGLSILRRATGPIRCYTPHGGSFNHEASPPVQALYMIVERVLAACTDMLLFESVFIANRFHQRIGDTSAMVRIVQNGIGPDEFVPVRPDAKAADLLYVGELRSAKGIDTLIDALAILQRRLDRPISLNLAGTGPDQSQLEARARSRGIAEAVRFLGSVPARRAFALGRVLVVPSRAESLPYIVLEAAGAQVPMVATDVGGIGEVFGPYRDRLIACDDPIVLAKALERVIEADPHEVAAQGRDLAAYVATRFSIELMASSVIGGYHDAIARRTSATKSVERAIPAHS